ncbi:MAG TPA: metallopeptidase TldD-related protein [Kofleriaceae bacterium]|nr:metallopeptidase TldD-related protein [Kofleriaceae bacterium]
MAEWSRREVLRALGVGAATPAIGSLLSACGPRARGAVGPRPGARSPADVRAHLRDIVTELGRSYLAPSALATMRTRGGAAVDGNARGADRHPETMLVLRVEGADGRHEQVTNDLSVDGIERAAAWLRSRAPRDPGARSAELPAPREFTMPMTRDPTGLGPNGWLDEVSELYARGRRVGGSRIVYRGAYLTVDDCHTLHVSRSGDLLQRVVRARAGLLLVAWTGAAPTADEAGRAGALGLEVMRLEDDALEAAADRALAQLTAREAPEGATDVILDPTLAGLLASDALAPALSAPAWIDGESRAASERLIGSPAVSLIDDPTLPAGYGAYFFDDEGHIAAPTTLIDNGSIATPMTDAASAAALRVGRTGNARRSSATEPARVYPSNLGFDSGALAMDDLLAGIDRGLIVEGGLSLRIDPRSWRLVIRAGRARGVLDGKTTGARYGAVELRATLPALLRAVRGVGDRVEWQPRMFGELATAAGGPALLTRAEVRRG